MFAKSTRHACAGLSLMAVLVASANAQAPMTAAVYRAAVATYVKTGNPVAAFKSLFGWEQKALADAVAETIKAGDAGVNEAAALLHLEIAVAIAGLSTASTQAHLELGARLIDA